MRALLINAVCGIRSTGRICINLAEQLEKEGYDVKIAYGRESVPEQYKKYAVRIGGNFSVYWHALMSRCFDQRGYWSKIATRKFLKWADTYNPDLLWLHNIHDYFINFEMLFDWIKSRPNMKVKWTQHDCWAFTGGCMHFTLKNCYQWKTKCESCPKERSKNIRRMEKENFLIKKESFSGVNDMRIITPSNWMANLVRSSFLKEYPIEVVHNTINKEIFKPTQSGFREKYNLKDKKVILGVASAWGQAKGLYVFSELAEVLDESFKIVLVGLPKKLQRKMPDNILMLECTDNAVELAEIYTAADIFLNPSRQETFGMTTLEAISCGTDVIVFKDTACEEVANLFGGVVVEQDVQSVLEAIKNVLV